jgi:DNA-binding winged helix-turn-helix (wHTH) protein/tetratricopeptide (TPR) repeat protein
MSVYEFGPFQLDAEQLLLMRAGEPVALGPKVVETLLALVERPGDVLAKGALLDRVWPDGFVEEANLVQNIYVLRRTFRRFDAADPIETVPRRGYRFTAPVRLRASPPAAPAVAGTAAAPPRGPRAFSRRAAALAGAVFAAASIVLVGGSGLGHRDATAVVSQRAPKAVALSAKGAQFYLIGRYYWNLRTRAGVRTSLTYFARVVDEDPQSALGYAALADANVAMGDYCYGTHQPSVYFGRAREYANKALALNPSSAEAHAALGILALYGHDTAGAMHELERAIALDPAYAPAQEWYGIALVGRGRLTEGVARLKIAAALDPLSVATIAWLGSAAYRDGRFADAVAYSHQALELSPQRVDVLETMGVAYEAQGDADGAIDAFKRYGALGAYYRPEAAALLAHAYALAHRLREARSALQFARAHATAVDPADLQAAAAAVAGGTARLPDRRRHTSSYA